MQTKTPIEAVLFDYGMVLSQPADPNAWARMRALTGHDEPTLQQAYWTPRHDYDRGALSGRQYWHLVSRRPQPDQHLVDQLIAADNDLWTRPNQPMIDWALALQRAGIRTGILSNLGDAITEGVLARFDFSGFHHRTWSHTIGVAKPDPAIYAHATAGLQTPSGHILFIDDRADNIAAAQAAGMQTLQYTTHPAFEAEMRERGFDDLLAAKPGSGHPSPVSG